MKASNSETAESLAAALLGRGTPRAEVLGEVGSKLDRLTVVLAEFAKHVSDSAIDATSGRKCGVDRACHEPEQTTAPAARIPHAAPASSACATEWRRSAGAST